MGLELYARLDVEPQQGDMAPELFLSRVCARWPYSGFHAFRKRLAEAEGFPLESMQGFSDPLTPTPPTLPLRQWDSVSTPLKPLLDHSDSSGSLSQRECALIFPRLREIARTWAQDDYDRVQAERLATGMEAVAKLGGRIDFR